MASAPLRLSNLINFLAVSAPLMLAASAADSSADAAYTEAASRLAACHERDPQALEGAFRCLDAPRLGWLTRELSGDEDGGRGGGGGGVMEAVASALLRRKAHGICSREEERAAWAASSSGTSFEETLSLHSLPQETRDELLAKYGGSTAPSTWLESLERLRTLSGGSEARLWELLESHPMCAYVPVQCRRCGEVVPDTTTDGLRDEEVGLAEVEPTEEELARGVRAGWFRGVRGAVAFEIRCRRCGATSRWYRTSSPAAMLDPDRWGRLCGEQEDLRAYLADNLGIESRFVLPLDWDHVWTEVRHRRGGDGEWTALDPNARNFAARLDEGIGSWTRILALSNDPLQCEDVTSAYLRAACDGGRLEPRHASEVLRFSAMVDVARKDATGTLTQARTLNGYVLHSANFTAGRISAILCEAAKDYGNAPWWKLTRD